jgi:hypothetical protein
MTGHEKGSYPFFVGNLEKKGYDPFSANDPTP